MGANSRDVNKLMGADKETGVYRDPSTSSILHPARDTCTSTHASSTHSLWAIPRIA